MRLDRHSPVEQQGTAPHSSSTLLQEALADAKQGTLPRTSRLLPLDGGESKATDGDLDAPWLAAVLLCDLSTVSSRHCRQCKPMRCHAWRCIQSQAGSVACVPCLASSRGISQERPLDCRREHPSSEELPIHSLPRKTATPALGDTIIVEVIDYIVLDRDILRWYPFRRRTPDLLERRPGSAKTRKPAAAIRWFPVYQLHWQER